MTDLDKVIIEQIERTEENLLAASECSRVLPFVMLRLLQKRIGKIRKKLEEVGGEQIFVVKDISMNPDLYIWKHVAPIACSYTSEKVDLRGYEIRLEPTANNFSNFYLGLRRPQWLAQATEFEEQVHDFFNNNFFNEKIRSQVKPDGWWVWSVALSPPWNNWWHNDVLRALYGEELMEPEHDFLRLCSLLKQYLDIC